MSLSRFLEHLLIGSQDVTFLHMYIILGGSIARWFKKKVIHTH